MGGRYRLVAPLGTGASAEVFLAEDVRLGRKVAVKMLQPVLAGDDRFLRRFRAEAQTVANINHPNVVVIHDWGEDDDSPYLVSEYLPGGSLRAVLQAGHRLTPSQALVVGLDVCRGLAHAHNAGLVHRDLKPANLLFDTEGRLRIADFGLARAVAEAGVTEPEGSVLGTARYAAPEQARGERLTGKADVYALAIVLVEAVTGTVPFASDTTLGTLMARVDRDLEVPEELGVLRAAVSRAGHLDPDDRPDAEELGIMLLAASERLPAPAPLPLVGALVEAGQTSDRNDATQTMTLLPELDVAVPDADPGGDEPPSTTDDGGADASPRRRMPRVLAALLLVALGAVGFFAAQTLRTPTFEVPDVVGSQLSDLELIAEQNDWVLDEKKTRRDGSEVGEIVSTDPPAGDSLAEGGTLVVLVSEGNSLTDVPTDVAGRPLAEVAALFEEASLELATTEVADEEVPADHVIGFEGEVGERLPKGEAVPVLVSTGPAPREVPGYDASATYDMMAAVLTDLQLVPQKAEEFSDTVPAGAIIGLSEPPGSLVARGTTVVVTVSKGQDLVTIPRLTGLTLQEAEAALEAAGLRLGEFAGVGGSSRVVASSPGPGKQLKRGSTVDLLLGG